MQLIELCKKFNSYHGQVCIIFCKSASLKDGKIYVLDLMIFYKEVLYSAFCNKNTDFL